MFPREEVRCQEAGYGRYDIRCQKTIGDNSKAIIIEVTAVALTVKTRLTRKKKTKIQLEMDMEVQLLAAMNQLEERQYYSSLESHIPTVHEFGICFAGKLCVVGSRTQARGDSAMDWVVAPTKVSGAHFKQKDINEQKVVKRVEEVLEENDLKKLQQHHATSPPTSHTSRSTSRGPPHHSSPRRPSSCPNPSRSSSRNTTKPASPEKGQGDCSSQAMCDYSVLDSH